MKPPAAMANQAFMGADFILLQRIGLENERDALAERVPVPG